MQKMRAIVFNGKPGYRGNQPLPGRSKDEALVRVLYAGICRTDLEIIKGYMGFKGILGHEFSGVIEECDDKKLIGKRVTGEINLSCGRCGYCKRKLKNHCPDRSVLGIFKKDGAFADFLTLPVKNFHILPDSITDIEAVFIEPLAAAFEILEQVRVGRNEKVCVLGDGRLGILASQALFLTGCALITVGRHREKLSILENLGIETALGAAHFPRDFDFVIDCTGSGDGLETALKLVRPRGTIVLKTTVKESGKADMNRIVIDEITVIGSRCGPFKPAIRALKEGTVTVIPLISKIFSIEDGLKALEYAAKEKALKVILKVG